MVAEMRCVTSIYRLELGSESKQEWYLGLSVVGVPKSYRHKLMMPMRIGSVEKNR